ncbi:MAG TPA: T9SS type A sorting domain-containing protein, partial [Bacteroidia bacterium]
SNFSMPVKTTTGHPGNYTITAENVSSFPSGACILLYDSYTGISTDLRSSSYSFSLSDTTISARFTLNITIDPSLQVTSTKVDPTCSAPNGGQIVALGNSAGPWNYYWKDENGAPIKTSLNKTTADTLNVSLAGTYLLDVNTAGSCDNNSSQFTINNIEVPVADFTCEDTVYLSAGATVNIYNFSANATTNAWDFGDGTGTSSDAAPIYTYQQEGIYTILLTTESSTSCIDTAQKIVVVENNAVGLNSSVAGVLLIKTISEDQYIIQQKFNYQQMVSVKLYDASGKLVNDFGTNRTEQLNVNLDLSLKGAGIYYMRINSDAGQQTLKLIKQ